MWILQCEKVLLSKLDEENAIEETTCVQLYAKILKRRNNFKAILAKRKQFLSANKASNENILQLICEAYCRVSLKQDQYANSIDIQEYYEPLLNVNENSVFARIAKAIRLYNLGDYVESRDVFNRGKFVSRIIPKSR